MTVEIEQAFVSDFIAQGFGLSIAHENAEFTPVAGVAHVELRGFQNEVSPADLATTNDTTGFYQFALRYGQGTGAIPAKAKASEIFAAYPVGRRLSYGGQTVTITGFELFDAAPDEGWFKVVGRIFYSADIAR